MLERKLELSHQRCNAALAHNGDLRKRIDGQRRERLASLAVQRRLEGEVAHQRAEVGRVANASARAYAALDAAQAEMRRLRTQAEAEQAEFEAEAREAGVLLEQERAERGDHSRGAEKGDVVQMRAETNSSRDDPRREARPCHRRARCGG